jgi:hypothetical protein
MCAALKSSPGRHGEQVSELTPPVVVVDDNQRAAGAKYAHNLSEPRVASGWEEVGEPCVHHIHARIGQRNVFRRAVQNPSVTRTSGGCG